MSLLAYQPSSWESKNRPCAVDSPTDQLSARFARSLHTFFRLRKAGKATLVAVRTVRSMTFQGFLLVLGLGKVVGKP